MRHHRLVAPESLEQRQLLTISTVVISEFMASNGQTVEDGFGKSADWVEIFNGSEDAVDLQGWSLTDDRDESLKWEFGEETVLAPGGFLLVWASGEDTLDPAGEHHTNFKLDSDGEFLGLFSPEGRLVSSFGTETEDYPPQQSDVSYGLDADGNPVFWFSPSPRAANVATVQGQVADTKFSVDRGYFEVPFLLEIESSTPDATLVYTLDGSAPSESHGEQVVGGTDGVRVVIEVSVTSTVRAMAFRPGWLATNVDTQTYLFAEDVILQDGAGLPDTWGHAGADYEMDPEIINSALYRDRVIPGLESLPSVSLVTEQDNWFGAEGVGIYPVDKGSPRPVSVELLWADETKGFQVDGSVEIQGGTSAQRWNSDKLSMQLKFKRAFGDSKLKYSLFGPDAAAEFDTLILDARSNFSWHDAFPVQEVHQRSRAQYTRDQYVADLQNAMGGHAPHGQWVHVYLNGNYWGIYNLHERPDEHFAVAYLGGSEDDYDVIKHRSRVVNGSLANYASLWDPLREDLRVEGAYQEVAKFFDLDAFVNYMLLNYYVGNVDWSVSNWYASFNHNSPDGVWRFHSWDAEWVMDDLQDDVTSYGETSPHFGGPPWIHLQLMRNETYRLKFMDAVQAQLHNGGLLTPERAASMYQQRLDAVEAALVPESARWGDNRRDEPYTPDVEWAAERDRLLEEYFPRRTEVVLEQLRSRGFFHDFDAPRLSQHGGSLSPGSTLEIVSAGEVFYTLDGSDPHDSPTAVRYTGPFALAGDTELRVRGRHGDEWSALTTASFTVGVLGDFSGDGVLDATDIDLLFAAVRSEEHAAGFDLNADEQVDDADATIWIEDLAQTRAGDATLDGQVDFDDFLRLANRFGQADLGWSQGDFSGDGRADFEDFLILAATFGFSRAVKTPISPVPK